MATPKKEKTVIVEIDAKLAKEAERLGIDIVTTTREYLETLTKKTNLYIPKELAAKLAERYPSRDLGDVVSELVLKRTSN